MRKTFILMLALAALFFGMQIDRQRAHRISDPRRLRVRQPSLQCGKVTGRKTISRASRVNCVDRKPRRAELQVLTEDRASLCARLFAETTRDGVYTHGLNRFPRFVETIRNGTIDIHAEPTKTTGVGAIERWEGHRGVGNWR